MSVVILEAKIAPGYSGCDHMITGCECDAVVGQEFDTVAEACEAADAAAVQHADRRVIAGEPHVYLKLLVAGEETIERTT